MDKVRGTNVDTSEWSVLLSHQSSALLRISLTCKNNYPSGSPTKSGGLFDQAKHILSGSEGTSTARESILPNPSPLSYLPTRDFRVLPLLTSRLSLRTFFQI